MQDKPANLPSQQLNAEPLKPITQAVLERRATNHFSVEMKSKVQGLKSKVKNTSLTLDLGLWT